MLKKHFVISVLAADRPGIIADVADVIYQLEGDLSDMNQSVLNGFFSMIILASFDGKVSADDISCRLNDLETGGEINCLVRETASFAPPLPLPDGDIYVVTAQGENRTGLVASVSAFCRNRNINILGYDTKLSGNTYSMMLDIMLPVGLSSDDVHRDLAETGSGLGLKIVMQHKKLFETVNEISLF